MDFSIILDPGLGFSRSRVLQATFIWWLFFRGPTLAWKEIGFYFPHFGYWVFYLYLETEGDSPFTLFFPGELGYSGGIWVFQSFFRKTLKGPWFGLIFLGKNLFGGKLGTNGFYIFGTLEFLWGSKTFFGFLNFYFPGCWPLHLVSHRGFGRLFSQGWTTFLGNLASTVGPLVSFLPKISAPFCLFTPGGLGSTIFSTLLA